MQIADFGMARDITDNNYYVTKGGKIPAKWTPPEVFGSSQIINHQQQFVMHTNNTCINCNA